MGADVTYIARERTVGALQQNGLTVDMMEETLHLPDVSATTDPSAVGPVDVIIFATKLYDVDDAARAMAPLIEPETHVLSLQNGVYTEELLAELYGADHVWGAQSLLPAQVGGTGPCPPDRQHRPAGVRAAGQCAGCRHHRLPRPAGRGGSWALLAENTLECLWRKFVMVGSYAAVSTLVRARLGKVRSCPESWQLYRELMQEAFAVGQAKGAGMSEGWWTSTGPTA